VERVNEEKPKYANVIYSSTNPTLADLRAMKVANTNQGHKDASTVVSAKTLDRIHPIAQNPQSSFTSHQAVRGKVIQVNLEDQEALDRPTTPEFWEDLQSDTGKSLDDIYFQEEEQVQGFDELEDINEDDSAYTGFINKGQGATDLTFSYEELAKEAEKLQQRCMELSQENNAMKRDIKAGALLQLDLRNTYVGSTPYYPNRGRGQGFRGVANRGRQGNQGRSTKLHRSWSPESKNDGGRNNIAQQWRPKTPPADPTVIGEHHASPKAQDNHAPAESPNGNKPATSKHTVSMPATHTNITVENISSDGPEMKSWTHLFKDGPEKTFKLQYLEPELNRRDIVTIPESTISQGSIDWENTIMGYFLDKKITIFSSS